MKFIPKEHVETRQRHVGNPPLSSHDLSIATHIANVIENLPFTDSIAAALIAVDAVRHFDQPGKGGDADKTLEWYRVKANEGASNG